MAKEKKEKKAVMDPPMYYKVHMKFIREVLGTAPSNPDIYAKWILGKKAEKIAKEEGRKQEEVLEELKESTNEMNTLPDEEEVEGKTTVFHRDENDKPAIYCYTVKGFFKEACRAMREIGGSESSAFTGFQRHISDHIFVKSYNKDEDLITINTNDTELGSCSRSLRAQTAQGERVCLACSETVPSNSSIDFRLKVNNVEKFKMEPLVCEWLKYGRDKGLGQWRNSGKGRFVAEMVTITEEEWDKAGE